MRFEPSKTKHGRRKITIGPSTISVLRKHRRRQLEARLASGIGKPDPDALVFSRPDGAPISPGNLSRDWRRLVIYRKLPRVSFHALRHTHAGALVSGGLDAVTVSRHVRHGSPRITLQIYSHLFEQSDNAATEVIDAALRTDAERKSRPLAPIIISSRSA